MEEPALSAWREEWGRDALGARHSWAAFPPACMRVSHVSDTLGARLRTCVMRASCVRHACQWERNPGVGVVKMRVGIRCGYNLIS